MGKGAGEDRHPGRPHEEAGRRDRWKLKNAEKGGREEDGEKEGGVGGERENMNEYERNGDSEPEIRGGQEAPVEEGKGEDLERQVEGVCKLSQTQGEAEKEAGRSRRGPDGRSRGSCRWSQARGH